MITRNHVFKSAYYDSVVLMRLARDLEALDGVEQATAMMGTNNNKELLREVDLLAEAGDAATASDLIIALRLESIEREASALAIVHDRLATSGRGGSGGQDYRPRTLEGALRVLPDANLAIISLPGMYAASEAHKALDHGLHVLLFSDNVPLQDEVELKRRAVGRDLFMLGPDSGTAIINGVPLGFANAVPRGRVGVVSASGTGLQQVTCLLSRAEEGVSHALGVGGRDLCDQVGGLMMLEGLRALQEDPATEIIVLVSKPPGRSARDRVFAAARRSPKPCVVAFLGEDGTAVRDRDLFLEGTLEDAARRVLTLLGKEVPASWSSITEETWGRLQSVSASLVPGRRFIRGLYSGGTLCYEALLVVRELGEEVNSNLELEGVGQHGDSERSKGHTLLDLGDDRYTIGRPHPMIDFQPRCDHLIRESADPEVGVLLMDVVLGYGAHPDPAAELGPALKKAQLQGARAGRGLACVVAMCGTAADPQSLARQEESLTEAGAIVVHSNLLAARIAAALSCGDLSTLPRM